MIYQYYFKRIKLFKLPYRILLAYHSPAGNSVKKWTYYQMLPHIVAIRKEIHILSMTFTVIQIRKALNILFKRINTRGTLLINSTSNGIKMHNNSIFIFVSNWLPGLLTNYRQLILSIRRNQKYSDLVSFYLKRPQQYAASNTAIQPRPLGQRLTRTIKRRVPSLPSISLSLSDNPVWLNETSCLGIPSIQLCDTQSHYQKISYPIIANQQSITFSYLLVSLFAETCNYSLIFEHLYFLSFFKYLNVKKRLKKKLKRKIILNNLLENNFESNLDLKEFKNFYEMSDLGYKFWLKSYKDKKYNEKYYKGKKKYNIFSKKFFFKKIIFKKPLFKKKISIVNKKIFIFNSRLFAYQFRDIFISNSKISSNVLDKNYIFLESLRNYIFLFLRYMSRKIKLFEKFQKVKFYKKKKFLQKKFNLKKKLYLYRRYLHKLYVKIFGLTVVLNKKKKQKVRYINKIYIYKKDLPNRFFLGFLYMPKMLLRLQKCRYI